MRLWLKFSRADELGYISHLDTHRAYYRLFRRAELPLALSQGFNPHPILSLAAPMPLGYRSEADYVDLTLSSALSLAELATRLATTTGHEQFRFLGGVVVGAKAKPLAAEVAWTEYEISLPQGGAVEEALRQFAALENVPFRKETKKSVKQVDVKPLVRKAEFIGQKLRAVLSSSEPIVLRPDEYLALLSSLVQEKWKNDHVVRKELYLRDKDLVTPLERWLEGGENLNEGHSS